MQTVAECCAAAANDDNKSGTYPSAPMVPKATAIKSVSAPSKTMNELECWDECCKPIAIVNAHNFSSDVLNAKGGAIAYAQCSMQTDFPPTYNRQLPTHYTNAMANQI